MGEQARRRDGIRAAAHARFRGGARLTAAVAVIVATAAPADVQPGRKAANRWYSLSSAE